MDVRVAIITGTVFAGVLVAGAVASPLLDGPSDPGTTANEQQSGQAPISALPEGQFAVFGRSEREDDDDDEHEEHRRGHDDDDDDDDHEDDD